MKIPKYCKNGDGRAYVRHPSIPNKSHREYLGEYGTPESHRLYDQFVSRLLAARAAGAELLPTNCRNATIVELIVAYLAFAEKYYSENGRPTSEFTNMQRALEHVTDLFGDEPGTSFGPRSVTILQNHLIAAGYRRGVINNRVRRAKRFIRWCCKQELLPAEQYYKLACTEGLRKGRSAAKESEKVKPVPRQHADALLPFVSPQVAAMIQVQRICGMRPSEICIIKRSDLDMDGDIWLYHVGRHKGSHQDRVLIKAIPKVAQEILKQFFKPEADAFLFSPVDAERWRNEQRAVKRDPDRKTKIFPCELRTREKRKAARTAGQPGKRGRKKSTRAKRERYDRDSYRRAIEYGLKKAKRAGVEIPHWHPHQLRHSVATEIAKTFGLGQQAAQRWLGHADLDTTSIYVEKEVEELIEIARLLDKKWMG